VPERQRTLRATIDWSYSLLTEEEQVLFARLSVFQGGRTLEAIEAICNGDGALDVLGACAGPAEDGCTAPAFSLTFPDDNFFGLPAGTYAPAVTDGVYLLLAPLTPGAHTITFGGAGYAFGSISQDITYHLTVSS
jgi:hypothetical protein